MRMLLKITMPADKGSEAIKSGALKRTIETTMKTLKTESAYFFAEDGRRTGIMIFDMQGSWQLPAILEPLFASLGADLYLTPAMSAEDLGRGFKEAGI
ncbi:MAG TPA: hypothetical protein VNJ52_12060 [Patescibacteria group bacterium]|nr:hypothetical protein [Patescibacteria group bacterium]